MENSTSRQTTTTTTTTSTSTTAAAINNKKRKTIVYYKDDISEDYSSSNEDGSDDDYVSGSEESSEDNYVSGSEEGSEDEYVGARNQDSNDGDDIFGELDDGKYQDFSGDEGSDNDSSNGKNQDFSGDEGSDNDSNNGKDQDFSGDESGDSESSNEDQDANGYESSGSEDQDISGDDGKIKSKRITSYAFIKEKNSRTLKENQESMSTFHRLAIYFIKCRGLKVDFNSLSSKQIKEYSSKYLSQHGIDRDQLIKDANMEIIRDIKIAKKKIKNGGSLKLISSSLGYQYGNNIKIYLVGLYQNTPAGIRFSVINRFKAELYNDKHFIKGEYYIGISKFPLPGDNVQSFAGGRTLKQIEFSDISYSEFIKETLKYLKQSSKYYKVITSIISYLNVDQKDKLVGQLNETIERELQDMEDNCLTFSRFFFSPDVTDFTFDNSLLQDPSISIHLKTKYQLMNKRDYLCRFRRLERKIKDHLLNINISEEQFQQLRQKIERQWNLMKQINSNNRLYRHPVKTIQRFEEIPQSKSGVGKYAKKVGFKVKDVIKKDNIGAPFVEFNQKKIDFFDSRELFLSKFKKDKTIDRESYKQTIKSFDKLNSTIKSIKTVKSQLASPSKKYKVNK